MTQWLILGTQSSDNSTYLSAFSPYITLTNMEDNYIQNMLIISTENI